MGFPFGIHHEQHVRNTTGFLQLRVWETCHPSLRGRTAAGTVPDCYHHTEMNKQALSYTLSFLTFTEQLHKYFSMRENMLHYLLRDNLTGIICLGVAEATSK